MKTQSKLHVRPNDLFCQKKYFGGQVKGVQRRKEMGRSSCQNHTHTTLSQLIFKTKFIILRKMKKNIHVKNKIFCYTTGHLDCP